MKNKENVEPKVQITGNYHCIEMYIVLYDSIQQDD